MKKKEDAYKTIGEVAKIVGLVDKKKGTLSTHTIRFWETKFNQIKPKVLAGKRRYYDNSNVQVIKLIKHLLKDKGMTIKGVKNLLADGKKITVDDSINYSVGTQSLDKKKIIGKIKNISKIVNELKKIKNG